MTYPELFFILLTQQEVSRQLFHDLNNEDLIFSIALRNCKRVAAEHNQTCPTLSNFEVELWSEEDLRSGYKDYIMQQKLKENQFFLLVSAFLEEYRQEQWAEDVLTAYPSECANLCREYLGCRFEGFEAQQLRSGKATSWAVIPERM